MKKLTVEKSDLQKTRLAGKKSGLRFIVLDIISVIIWTYSLIKLFIFDIDVYLIKNFFQNFDFLIKYKFVIILLVITAFVLISKKWKLVGDSFYVLFFPLIIIFWKIPILLLKIQSWNLFFILLTYVAIMLRSARFSFVTNTVILTCIVAILASSRNLILWPSVLLLLIITMVVIFQRIISVYTGSPILKYVSDAVSFVFDKGKPTFTLENEVKTLPVEKLTESQLQKWSTSLQLSVIFCKGCAFLTRRLRDFQRSKYSTIVYILNFLSLVLFSMISFAFIYYGLFKINAHYYITSTPQFFDFFYFSFNKAIYSTIAGLQVTGVFPKIITMIQQFVSVCFFTFIVMLFVSINDEKRSNEVDEVINKIEKNEKMMELNIQDQFSLTIIDAIKKLEKYSAGMIKVIYFLSKDIE